MTPGDGVDRDRWDRSHAAGDSPRLQRIRRATVTAALPGDVEPTTVWPAWPLERVLDELDLGAGETLVDLGCGRGEIGLWIASRAGARLVGVDPSPAGLAMASERATRMGAGATFVDGVLRRTGLESRSADAVLVVDVMHFLEAERGAALQEIARVLRAQRRLVVVGPERSDPSDDLRRAGFAVEVRAETPEWRERMREYGAALRREGDALRDELGPAMAEELMRRPEQAVAQAAWHGLTAARALGE